MTAPDPDAPGVPDAAADTRAPAGGDESRGVARIVDVTANQVYAHPVRTGDRVVIPAAAITRAGGFGRGTDHVGNVGGGGGGRGLGRPVAVVEAGPAGVHVRPVVDLTKIGLTALAAAFLVWRALRR